MKVDFLGTHKRLSKEWMQGKLVGYYPRTVTKTLIFLYRLAGFMLILFSGRIAYFTLLRS